VNEGKVTPEQLRYWRDRLARHGKTAPDAADSGRAWESWVDERIGAAIAAEHGLMIGILTELTAQLSADLRAETASQVKDAKLEMANRLLDALGRQGDAAKKEPYRFPREKADDASAVIPPARRDVN
jgi:hypothetical protein